MGWFWTKTIEQVKKTELESALEQNKKVASEVIASSYKTKRKASDLIKLAEESLSILERVEKEE